MQHSSAWFAVGFAPNFAIGARAMSLGDKGLHSGWVLRDVFPWEEYRLAQSRVETELPEDDLFAGVRASSLTRSAGARP